MRGYRSLVCAISSVACFSASSADLPAATKSDPRADIARLIPNAKPENVRSVADGDLFEVDVGGRQVYVTRDGKYLIAGDLFDVKTNANLSDATRKVARKSLLQTIDESRAVIFEDATQKRTHTITVFTDPDCTYCRKFHGEIAKLTGAGVRVRYLAFPRTGPGTDSWRKTEAVWCSKDRNQALTLATSGAPITAPECATPVAEQYELGKRLGLNGTPMILDEDGTILGGYLAPPALLAKLQGVQAKAPATAPAKSKQAADKPNS